MSAFKLLRDVSNNFEQDLQKASTELFSAKIGESFEDSISKQMKDLQIFSSKLKLLRAKPLSLTPQVQEQAKLADPISQYEDTVEWRVLEQTAVKSLTTMHAVRALITTPNTTLDPEMMERKEKIIQSLSEYRNKESQLRHLDELLKEKETEHMEVLSAWDRELGELRDLREQSSQAEEEELQGPLYEKLRVTVDKLEMMRWLIARLMTSRAAGYDWLADPRGRIEVAALTRHAHTVQSFITDS